MSIRVYIRYIGIDVRMYDSYSYTLCIQSLLTLSRDTFQSKQLLHRSKNSLILTKWFFMCG